MFFRREKTPQEKWLEKNRFDPDDFKTLGKKPKENIFKRIAKWICGCEEKHELIRHKSREESPYTPSKIVCRVCGEDAGIPKNQLDIYGMNKCVLCGLEERIGK